MAKNMKKHSCNDTCKGRSINTVSCFLCSELFYAKCFSLDTQTQTKINTVDSCLRFICGMCQSNCNVNKRKSLGANMNNSQSSTSTSDNNNNELNDNIKKILDLLSMRTPSNSTVNNNTNKFHAEQSLATENIYKIVLKIDNKIDKLHSISNEKDSIQIITNLIENKLNATTAPKMTNSLNTLSHSLIDSWQLHDSINESQNSFTGRPSLLIKQSVDDDIMEILKNSDRITWNTLDHLSSVINAQSIKIDTLLSANGLSSSHRITSPLVDTIFDENDSFVVDVHSANTHNNLNNSVQLASSNSESESHSNNVNDRLNEGLLNGTGAERLAGSPSNNSSGDVQVNVHSNNDTSAERLAGTSSTEQSSAGSHNDTELLSNSLLHGELNDNSTPSGSDDQITGISVENISLNVSPELPQRNTTSSSRELNHHFHLSKTSTDTTVEMIYDHLRKNGIVDFSNVKVTKLVPRNRDISTLSFISFKIDTNDDIATMIDAPNFWPKYCSWKNFVPKAKHVASFANNGSFLENRQFTRRQPE